MNHSRPRFTLFFLDTILISVWYFLCAGIAVTVVSAAFPSVVTWVKQFTSPQQLASGTVMVFLAASGARLAANKGFPIYTVPVLYAITAVGYTTAIYNGLVLSPQGNFWLASTFPAFMSVLALWGGRFIWNKIKPRRRKRRLPDQAIKAK